VQKILAGKGKEEEGKKKRRRVSQNQKEEKGLFLESNRRGTGGGWNLTTRVFEKN